MFHGELYLLQCQFGRNNRLTVNLFLQKLVMVILLKFSIVFRAIVAHTTQNSGFYTFLTQLPTFLKGN